MPVIAQHQPAGPALHRMLPAAATGPYRNVHCLPIADAAHGTGHILKAPMDGPEMIFFWDAQFHNWVHCAGRKRATFQANYLASHGWSYVRPILTK